MCHIVEVFNADAAYYEQLAGKLLQKGNQDPAGSAELQLARVFPTMVVVGQDKPHGARRPRGPTHPDPTPGHNHQGLLVLGEVCSCFWERVRLLLGWAALVFSGLPRQDLQQDMAL